MELFGKIRQAGFTITLEGEKIRVEFTGQGEPPKEAKALLDTLRERKVEAVAYLKRTMPKPFLEPDWSIVIPFGSDSRYQWWKGGQTTVETIEELKGAVNA